MTQSIRPLSFFSLSPISLTGISFAVVGVLFLMALSVSPYSFRTSTETVHIYCTSVAINPMQRVVDRFNQSDHAKSNLVRAEIVRAGGTSELAGQISAENSIAIKVGCDIFVSADQTRIQPMVENGQITSVLSIVSQRPVIAVSKKFSFPSDSDVTLDSLLNSTRIRLAIGSKATAIGAKTRQFAKNRGLLQKLEARKVTDCENVMILAQALATNSVDAAVIWDCTATQINAQNPASIRVAGYLDPDHQNFGLIQVAQTQLARPAAAIFNHFVRANIDEIKNEFSISGFSRITHAPLEQID